MLHETYEAIKDTAPLRYPLGYEHFRKIYPFGVVRGEQGEPLALLREPKASTNIREGLVVLRALRRAGVATARALPFINTDGRELILTEYVDGPNLRDVAQSLEPEVIFSHAVRLGNFYMQQTVAGQKIIGDIYAPFQYVVHDGRPVLVDLDMQTGDSDKTTLRGHLGIVSHLYQQYLPTDWPLSLDDAFNGMQRQYALSGRA